MKVYFISGLGADERVFRNIQLPSHQIVHLNWIPPYKNESLQDYATRLAQGINNNEQFGLVGLSYGGMVATEIAKQLRPAKTVVISSIPLSSHMPSYFKFAGFLGLHKIVPISFIKGISRLKRVFTTETSEDKKMVRAMIQECDPQFIRWAFIAALSWKNNELPGSLYHVHGAADEILPLRFTKPDYIIKRAGHLMVLNRAKEINEILKKQFNSELS